MSTKQTSPKRSFFKFGLFSVVLSLAGCNTGYQEVDGQWSYVTWDEGHGTRVKPLDVNPATFQVLKNKDYAKDDEKVFFLGRPIEGAHAPSFETLKGKYFAKDQHQVFLRAYTVINADPNTFSEIKFPYARDANKVYCGTIPMQVDQLDEFKVLKRSSSISITSKEEFIRQYGDQFDFLDQLKDHSLVYGRGKAKTKNQRFVDFHLEGHAK